ncbi:MAG TPA: metal ABC transporter permease [Clostridia bacterium]|nr:metal ABC transporter permease [Clostridia bacterium]
MQKALVAGVITGVVCSFLAFFVVLKRFSFITVGVSHSAVGGVGFSLFLGVNPVIGGTVFATLVAWGIGAVSKRGKINEETAIGIFFSAAMALGIAFFGLTKGVYADLFGYFFGNILAVGPLDLWILGISGAAVVLVLAINFHSLLFMCFDEDLAQAHGVPVGPLYYLLLTCLAVTTMVAVRVVGLILASALLVIPAATGYEVFADYRRMLWTSLVTGVVSTVGGLYISYLLDLPSGAAIVLFAACIFFVALILSPKKRVARRLSRKERIQSNADRTRLKT